MFTAILFAVDPGGTNQTFTLSRIVDKDNKRHIYTYMKSEGKVSDDAIDTILLLDNGKRITGVDGVWEYNPPEVVRHWTALNGDFVGLSRTRSKKKSHK